MPRRLLIPLLLLLCSLHARAQQAPPASAPAATQPAPLRLVLVGDSTMANYPDSHTNRGWGQYLEEAFRPGTVKVLNLAASGRSTKTFIQEGRWQKALDEKPHIILIQFGHNDSHAPENPESTNAGTDYQTYLRRYIDDARAIHAAPILITPMVRRTFTPQGKITGNLQPYADAMKAVAQEKKVPLIDLHASSLALAEKLGPDTAATHAARPGDATHFNEKGARAIVDLVLRELPTVEVTLKPHLKTIAP